MKEKILKALKSNLTFSLVLNFIIMAFCIWVTSFSYENGQDFNNSILICRNHFYYSSTINYILAVAVGTIQYAVTDINAFVMVEIALSFFAFTSITYVFADKFDFRKAFVFSMVVNILFSLNHYSRINSTKTAALLLAAGFLLVLNAIRNKRYNLPCWIGVFEIALGSFYNYTYFFAALGFGVAYFVGDMIVKKKYRLDFQKIFWYFRPFLLMFLLVTLVSVGLNQFSYSINHATDEAINYYDYSALQDSIDTLPYPSYDDHAEEFAQVGIDNDSEYELLKNGYYDDSKMLNINSLRLVNQIQQRESNKTVLYSAADVFADMLGHFAKLDAFMLIIIVFLAISAVFILYHKNRFSFFPLFYAVTGYAASVTLRYLFNGADYRIYGVWLFIIVFLLYSFNFELLRPQKPALKIRMKHGHLIISCAILIVIFGGYCTVYTLNSNDSANIPRNLITEISRNPDRYYVMDTVSQAEFIKSTENYMHPLWGFRNEYLENLDSFGYFHNNEMLRKRNMSENIYEAVLSNHKIYVIDKNITFKKEKYFTINYSDEYESVIYDQINELDGYKIYEVKIQRE